MRHAPDREPARRLTAEQIEELGREFDAIHDEVFADLGDRDARYIRSHDRDAPPPGRVARVVLLFASRYRPAWLAGTAGALGWPRSSRTWRSATTSCTASGTG